MILVQLIGEDAADRCDEVEYEEDVGVANTDAAERPRAKMREHEVDDSFCEGHERVAERADFDGEDLGQ